MSNLARTKETQMKKCTEKIFCCTCDAEVTARLTNGGEIYPHRPDLYSLPFWRCDACLNFVGCHHKTKNRTKPLGCIPSADIKAARMKIHGLIDPLWKDGRMARNRLYALLSEALGREYHTADLRDMREVGVVLQACNDIVKKLTAPIPR